jgi:hypothetical protein
LFILRLSINPGELLIPVESHWGIFQFGPNAEALSLATQWVKYLPTPNPLDTTFYVYMNGGWPDNHFSPTGIMGDEGDIHINQVLYGGSIFWKTVQSKVVYDAAGAGPHNCEVSSPCKMGWCLLA